MESGEGEREGGRKDRIRERVRIFKYYKTVGNRETKGDRAFVCLYKCDFQMGALSIKRMNCEHFLKIDFSLRLH